VLVSIALLGACSKKQEQPKPEPQLTLHEMMTKKIDPDADAIWAIGNAAIDDKAGMDPAKMTEKNWKDLGEAGARMGVNARELAALDPIVVTRPGVKIADEGVAGAPGPAQIQGHIARDTDVYRSLAQSLADHGDQLAAASRTKDAATAGRLISELDGVCESCHLEFWYPEQKALVQSIQAKAEATGR
jgi:hypothetical protein